MSTCRSVFVSIVTVCHFGTHRVALDPFRRFTVTPVANETNAGHYPNVSINRSAASSAGPENSGESITFLMNGSGCTSSRLPSRPSRKRYQSNNSGPCFDAATNPPLRRLHPLNPGGKSVWFHSVFTAKPPVEQQAFCCHAGIVTICRPVVANCGAFSFPSPDAPRSHAAGCFLTAATEFVRLKALQSARRVEPLQPHVPKFQNRGIGGSFLSIVF